MATSDNEIIFRFQDMNVSDRTNMLNRNIATVFDSNNGSYNGQIVFDLSSIQTSSGWVSFQEGYIQFPYIISAKSETDNTFLGASLDGTSVYLKDGYHQLISNCLIEVNGRAVQQVQNFSNAHIQFKYLTTSSYDDLFKNYANTGFTKDVLTDMTANLGLNSTAPKYADGNGYINNSDSNDRSELLPYKKNTTNLLPTMKVSAMKDSGMGYFEQTGTQDTQGAIYNWVFMATIMLKDISHFFEKLPVSKCADIKLTITYNRVQFNINCNARTGTPPTTQHRFESYQQISGDSCPFIVNGRTIDFKQSNGATPPVITSVAGIVSFRSNAVKIDALTNSAVGAFTQCRLYVPIYKIADNISLSMLQNYPTTKVVYNDIYSRYFTNISANSAINLTVNTGVINPQYIVVIPYARTNDFTGVSDMQSPFSSCPGTSSAVILSQFNVEIAGLKVFQSDVRYSFENYLNEVLKINAINGNNTLGLTSGVLNYHEWQMGYRMYVADLSRRENSQDDVTKSIVIVGYNDSDVAIDLLVFVAYKKSVSIDTATGLLKD